MWGLPYFAQFSSSSNRSNQQGTSRSPRNHKNADRALFSLFFISVFVTIQVELKGPLTTFAEDVWPVLAVWLLVFLFLIGTSGEISFWDTYPKKLLTLAAEDTYQFKRFDNRNSHSSWEQVEKFLSTKHPLKGRTLLTDKPNLFTTIQCRSDI